MNVGFVGFGLMGQKRAKATAQIEGVQPTAVFDPDPAQAESLQAELGYDIEANAESLLARDDIEVAVLAVPHHLTLDLALAAFSAGKHVFCEKPIGRNVAECRQILAAAEDAGRELGVGFNYRYYPGVAEARRQIEAGALGEPTHLRFVLGHAGRPGYAEEWKTSRELCGGGALLDPGIHVLDLIAYLLGPIEDATVDLFRSYWNLDVEDNAVACLRLEGNRRAFAHVSITEWQNEFALDVFGTDGCLRVRGRSGFYGAQRIELVKRWSWLSEAQQAQEFSREYSREDDSFRAELHAFFERLSGRPAPGLATPSDALAALSVVERLYEQATTEWPPVIEASPSMSGVR